MTSSGHVEWRGAVRRGDLAAVRRLLESGSDVNARDRYGQTALMTASRDGNLEIVHLLIANGTDLDHTAKYGLSALMLAVINGHVEIVQVLAQAGARQDLRGTGAPGFSGQTALDLATARGDRTLVAALRS